MNDTPDFLDHYEPIEDADDGAQIDSLKRAQELAQGDMDRVWFVRHDDGCDCDAAGVEDENDCQCEPAWTVERYDGQFVNRACYFVSTVPCRPEHRATIFSY